MLRLYQSRRDQDLQDHRRWEMQKVLSPKPIPNTLRTECDGAVNGWGTRSRFCLIGFLTHRKWATKQPN